MPTVEQYAEHEEWQALQKVVIEIDGNRYKGTEFEDKWEGGILLEAQERLLSSRDYEKIQWAHHRMQLSVEESELDRITRAFMRNPLPGSTEEDRILSRADDGLSRMFGKALSMQKEFRASDVRARMGHYVRDHGAEYAKALRVILEEHAADVIRMIHKYAEWNSFFGMELEEQFPELMDSENLKRAVVAEQRAALEEMQDYQG